MQWDGIESNQTGLLRAADAGQGSKRGKRGKVT